MYQVKASTFSKTFNSVFKLKLLERSDAYELFNAIVINKYYLYQWLPWVEATHSALDSQAFIEENLRRFARGESMITGIWHEELLIGCIGFNEINRLHKKATMGYWLAKDYRGKGLVTDACCLLINYAFEELKLNRIEILCAFHNQKSRAVAHRLGFVQEGVLRDYLRLYEEYTDMVLYSMLRKDWTDRYE